MENSRRQQDEWTPFSNLQGFVRLVLLVDWEPIGVFGKPNAMDEYDDYAPEICKLLCSGTSRETLIAHLDKIEKQQMRLRGERPAQAEVADKLLLLYRTISEDEQRRKDYGEV